MVIRLVSGGGVEMLILVVVVVRNSMSVSKL